MAQGSKSAGVDTREVDLTFATSIEPVGIPAGIIGTSPKGPAFVPLTIPTMNDYIIKFGKPTSDFRYGPLASSEWLRETQALTFLRVLGAGNGQQRTTSGNNQGKVTNAGFVVGDQQPQATLTGALGTNTYANSGGPLGRTYFLGGFMSQSVSSSIFTDAGLSSQGVPVVRGVLMAASGVVLTLSSSFNVVSTAPSTTLAATPGNIKGSITGAVNLSGGKQEFVMLLNGHKALDTAHPNVLTASFDVSAPNYFASVFNLDPLKLEQAGHVLYTHYDIHPAIATITGSGVVLASSGAGATGQNGVERSVFLLTSSQGWNTGTTTVPSYENFEDRFQTAKTPWFVSQKFGGKPINLFQVWSLGDGTDPNTSLKISIENVQPSNSDITLFGTFDLIIRDFTDNDNNKVVLEQWRGLSLDPTNPRFIGNIIGDIRVFFNFDSIAGKQKLTVDNTYPVHSRYVRVQLSDDVINEQIPETALPMGFRGTPHLMTSGSAPMPAFTDAAGFTTTNPFYGLVQPPVPMRLNLTRGSSPTQTTDKALYWGVQFEEVESAVEPNASYVPNSTLQSLAAYFPTFQTVWQNVIVSGNEGTADTAANGIIDADRFNNNLFSLENIKVAYNATSGIADSTLLTQWSYVRNGSIPLDSVGLTRALSVSDLLDPSNRTVAKFTVYMQGGFNGVRIFDEDAYKMTNKSIVEEMTYTNRGLSNGSTVTAYLKALTIFDDTTEVDVQLVTLPGIRHRFVTDTALRIAEDRFDAMVVFDVEERDIVNSLVTTSDQFVSVNYTATDFSGRGLNSSFGAAYFPDVNLRDTFNNESVRVPPSVAVIGAFAKNDAIANPWDAPAGFTRGTLPTTNDTVVRLSRTNMDALQSVNINPIVSFAGSTSPVVWGQKTVLARQSSLDRVNVRRLLIAIRRDVKAVADKILFEQNREATIARFNQLVNPILKKVQDQNGVNAFKVEIDTNTTTQADIENKTIRGNIFIVPTKVLETLSIDFVINNAGSTIT